MSAIPDTDWADLFVEYQPRIHNYFQRRIKDLDLVDDFTSETFIKAIDASEREMGANSHFSGWLYRIARNLMFDHFREKERRQFVSIDSVAELYDPGDLHTQTEAKLELEKVQVAVRRLTDEQQTVLSLRAEHGMQFSEIGQMMGKSESATKGLLHRAREGIEASLGMDGRPPKSSDCQNNIAETLRENGPMLVAGIIKATGFTRNMVYSALYRHPERFCKVEAIKRRGKPAYRWGLVGTHDKESA